MNDFEFGNLLKNVVENYSDIIEKSEKLKQSIDFKFEIHTKSFFYRVFGIFMTFTISYLSYLFGGFSTSTNQILLSSALMAWFALYCFELIAIKVEGFEAYLQDPWNLLD